MNHPLEHDPLCTDIPMAAEPTTYRATLFPADDHMRSAVAEALTPEEAILEATSAFGVRFDRLPSEIEEQRVIVVGLNENGAPHWTIHRGLEDCPWCATDGVMIEERQVTDGHYYYQVSCPDCYLKSPEDVRPENVRRLWNALQFDPDTDLQDIYSPPDGQVF